ncbi:metalloregulator ArsR/SmtB family transcription factor [Alkaliphilus serpentinus]|uniref:Metalloregulator ArsR/SmtB family transcription factor n=2 Tax=Alkaliphilus serpentinus TaxID=1482731 RepID=A0A833HQS1_9FIRM|nr:metalloregulator ArsR/SmtB family transcription factor [Alkaliphilus serpentinus]
MRALINIFKVLADETRLRILVLLYQKKLCVCQLQGVMKESQPKISKHLAKLRNMGFVKDERDEKFIFYYLNKENKMLVSILENITRNTEDYPTLKEDLLRISYTDDYIKEKMKELKDLKKDD